MADNQKIREEVKYLTDQLESGIQDLYTSDKYAAYLGTLAKFHSYSSRNIMLIHAQMPEATNVAGFNKWKNEFDRHVMKGQKGIRILAPAPFMIKRELEKIDPETQVPLLDSDGKPIVEEVDITIPAFKPVSVFDVSQTDGKPLPALDEILTGDVQQFEAFLDSLKSVSAMPVDFAEMDDGTDGYCNFDTRTISIRNTMSEAQTIAAVIHEMTHAELHDYNERLEQREPVVMQDTPTEGGAEVPEQKPRSRRAEEVEAESVSYVVCQHYGIETGANSFGYIANWSKGQELSELKSSLEVIRKTATSMIERVDGRFAEICKERGTHLSPSKEATVTQPEQAETSQPTISLNNAPKQRRQYYITANQREQAERMAEKWNARAEAFYADSSGWGFDIAGYCKTQEEADQAVETADSIRTSISKLVDGNGTWADVQVIRQAVSARDELDAQVIANQDAGGHEAPAIEVDAPDQEATAQEPEQIPQPEPAAPVRYTELQQRGFEIARQYEKLPLQDRISIIAETFGCKTGSISTSPCTGKWRGTSDISLDLDNGSSLFIGNYSTPKAKTAKVQNECVNATLARYNPEILAEIKARATTALLKREAEDKAIAAQKGLKPYTFLNVELNDGSDQLSINHMGWYYATLAVDGKIFAFVETGLKYDIARGVLAESRPNYFVAGGLEDSEVDFVFNNVGHSSTSGVNKLHLSDNALKRAEKTMEERIAAQRAEHREAAVGILAVDDKHEPSYEPMPDPHIGFSERDLYGYTDVGMYPLLMERALELYNQDHTVYLLFTDGTEAAAFEREDIENHDGIFGIETEEWEATQEFGQMKAGLFESEASKESDLEHGEGDIFAIYQLKDGAETRDYRFESLERLEARNLSVDRDHYDLVYSAPFMDGDTLDSIYQKFNTDHPDDFMGHSLSVSDVVVFRQAGETTAHYVDALGFKELPDFFNEKEHPQKSLPEVAKWESSQITNADSSTPPQPTVAELEAQAKAGQQVSLFGLAQALKAEQPQKGAKITPNKHVVEKKPSILAQLREAKEATSQRREQPKSAPKRNNEMEV